MMENNESSNDDTERRLQVTNWKNWSVFSSGHITRMYSQGMEVVYRVFNTDNDI